MADLHYLNRNYRKTLNLIAIIEKEEGLSRKLKSLKQSLELEFYFTLAKTYDRLKNPSKVQEYLGKAKKLKERE